MKETAIVTGCAGFIGHFLVERLIRDGWRVVGIDNLSRRGSVANLQFLKTGCGDDFRFEHCDIRDYNRVERIFAGSTQVRAVIHEAAQVAVTTSVDDPRQDFEINLGGTFNLLEATRRHARDARFVFASTNKVYGELGVDEISEGLTRYSYSGSRQGIGEDQPLDFHSPYGCSKGAADQYVLDYARIFGLKTTVFRQSCIYGPRQFGVEDQGWVSWFAIAHELGIPITVFGNGKQVRDLLHISDLVELYSRSLSLPIVPTGVPYNVGGGLLNTLSIIELMTLLEQFSGKSVSFGLTDWRPGDQKLFVSDNSRALRDFGWAPTVSPQEGVRSLTSWVKENSEEIRSVRKLC
jgi:CDP-paratose 2-epimerase